MVDDHQAHAPAESEQEKPIFAFRVIGIVDQAGVLVLENRLGLLKGDAMLAFVALRLIRIPVKSQPFHNYNVYTPCSGSNRSKSLEV